MKNKMKVPICPYCKSDMEVVEYRGYYDAFTYWECKKECSPEDMNEKVDRENIGDYAC